MSRPLQLTFRAAAIAVDKLPSTRTEIAFLGRSNVGKSSLLNALAGTKLAPVSNTPGRTQVLNCYGFDRGGGSVVDCPGYGFAKAPKAIRSKWLPMVERYLLEREELAMVMLLVDGEIGPTKSDLEMLDWLRAQSVPHSVIATKRDKVKPGRRAQREREVAAACRADAANILWVSAADDAGISELRERIRLWLA